MGKVLHVGWGIPKFRCRLGREWIESGAEEKGLSLLVDEDLSMSWQCALTAQKTNCVLGCIRRSVANRSRKDMDQLESVQRKDMKMAAGLEHFSYEDRLRFEVVQPGKDKAPGRL
ncbi:hypothetical protein WISP_78110 [Willisornis vidua]|uniref:Uncharacterized protein n=1 Tax=Willisornis vidua TaxID=1566151 RepID=A0ABQ9D8D9_9PASS|nr:hypothetical protein WISP_78110 [Willisornis vidua]